MACQNCCQFNAIFIAIYMICTSKRNPLLKMCFLISLNLKLYQEVFEELASTTYVSHALETPLHQRFLITITRSQTNSSRGLIFIPRVFTILFEQCYFQKKDFIRTTNCNTFVLGIFVN
jgi:hypothetical protein